MNGLTYVPYKKCTAIMRFVLKLSTKIWKSRDIPTDWAIAYIKLLSKSYDLSVVSEFKPIAITCVSHKIFFSILLDRLQDFMLQNLNSYISNEVEKSFFWLGCLDV